MIETRLLYYFLAVAREQNITQVHAGSVTCQKAEGNSSPLFLSVFWLFGRSFSDHKRESLPALSGSDPLSWSFVTHVTNIFPLLCYTKAIILREGDLHEQIFPAGSS